MSIRVYSGNVFTYSEFPSKVVGRMRVVVAVVVAVVVVVVVVVGVGVGVAVVVVVVVVPNRWDIVVNSEDGIIIIWLRNICTHPGKVTLLKFLGVYICILQTCYIYMYPYHPCMVYLSTFGCS